MIIFTVAPTWKCGRSSPCLPSRTTKPSIRRFDRNKSSQQLNWISREEQRPQAGRMNPDAMISWDEVKTSISNCDFRIDEQCFRTFFTSTTSITLGYETAVYPGTTVIGANRSQTKPLTKIILQGLPSLRLRNRQAAFHHENASTFVLTIALSVLSIPKANGDCPGGNQPNNVVGGACDCLTGWTPAGNGQCCSPNSVFIAGSGGALASRVRRGMAIPAQGKLRVIVHGVPWAPPTEPACVSPDGGRLRRANAAPHPQTRTGSLDRVRLQQRNILEWIHLCKHNAFSGDMLM
jgi:hypothetical protein